MFTFLSFFNVNYSSLYNLMVGCDVLVDFPNELETVYDNLDEYVLMFDCPVYYLMYCSFTVIKISYKQ